MQDTDKDTEKMYRKLSYYFESHKKIYFKTADRKLFRTGIILEVNKEKRLFILKESVLGELPFLFEDVDYDSIALAEVRK